MICRALPPVRPTGRRRHDLLFIPLVLGFIVLALHPTTASAQVLGSNESTIQGRLTTPDGQPVPDGTHEIEARLYGELEGGSPLFEETHTVETRDGVFALSLGSETALDPTIFAEAAFLALTIDDEDLVPRLPLTAVPMALRAGQLAASALEEGANVSITESSDGRLLIAATGDAGGLTSVTSDATLGGDGTEGAPLRVSAPLELEADAEDWVVAGRHANGHAGSLGQSTSGVSGEHSNGNLGLLGTEAAGAYGEHSNGNFGRLGGMNVGAFGRHDGGNFGLLGSLTSGAYGEFSNGNFGRVGSETGGVYGEHSNGNFGRLGGTVAGAFGQHENGNFGRLGATNTAVFGSAAGGNLAGRFSGNVDVTGSLSKGGGAFKIDHPLDPEGKYLAHSFVESPDMMNVYNGNVILAANGEAIVELPPYFEALNRDFRYQLTCIGSFAPVYVAEKISNGRFRIAGGQSGIEVSWQVTGIRQDAWANEHRIAVEEEKPPRERGYYLHPQLFGQPQERSIDWALDPVGMREIAERTAP